MEGTNVSRRDFLRGAGAMGVAAGALALAGSAGAVTAVADEAEGAVPAIAELANETAWIPVQKVACPGPVAPSPLRPRPFPPTASRRPKTTTS